ncbi:MAG TPA: hypothetical protein VM120_15920 [Bryobacteraceae bacterium]|nr:hypothetical protein [Bryobacteraceae bacterium]
MKQFSCIAFLSAGVLFADLAAGQTYGQRGDPYYQNGRGYNEDSYNRSRGGYGNERFGYGGNASLIPRVLSNIERAASNAHLDRHEAKHFNEAARKLEEFESRLARGKFDTGRLDKAIDSIQHLVEADRVHPRDRSRLSRDLSALRQFRWGGGQYGPGGDYRDERYYRNNRR